MTDMLNAEMSHAAVHVLHRLGYKYENNVWLPPLSKKLTQPTVEDIGIVLFKTLRPNYEDPLEDVYHETCGGLRDYLPFHLVGTRDPEGNLLSQWPKTPAWKYYYGKLAETLHRKFVSN
jgi:hypothetical protein